MTKTYTPLIIEGKIYVVVDAPEKPIQPRVADTIPIFWYKEDLRKYDKSLAACTKYPTIETDAPYWQERIGQRVEVEFETENEPVGYAADSWRDVTYAIPPQKDPLVNMLVTASVGTQSQHDTIQAHMDEYFKRWPSYKDRLTELEWYHLFLDFSDKLAIPPQQKQGDENWKVKFKDILMHADNRSGLETSIFTNEEWDYICSVLK